MAVKVPDQPCRQQGSEKCHVLEQMLKKYLFQSLSLKKSKLILAISTTLSVSTTSCTDDEHEINGACYLVTSHQLNQSDAKSYCESRGMYLPEFYRRKDIPLFIEAWYVDLIFLFLPLFITIFPVLCKVKLIMIYNKQRFQNRYQLNFASCI